MAKYLPNLQLKGAKVLGGTFKNFSGTKTKYNAEGNRNFCVRIDDPELATTLSEDGWNIKIRPARDEDEDALYYVKCNLRDNSKVPPDVYSVQERGGRLVRTKVEPENWGIFDTLYIESIDVELTPWKSKDADPDDPYGAYVKTLFVHVPNNDFANMYADEDLPVDEETPF